MIWLQSMLKGLSMLQTLVGMVLGSVGSDL